MAYVRNLENTFTAIDEEILADCFDVATLYFATPGVGLIPASWRGVRRCDVVVAWFASWHTLPAFLVAAVLRRPRVLITGGYDVADQPEIDYGLRRGGLPKLLSTIVFRLATVALPFSRTAYDEALKNTPLTAQDTQVLALGVPDHESNAAPTPKQRTALTIGGVDRMSVRRKGIGEFVRSAQYLPDVRFVVVGRQRGDVIDELRAVATDNVEFAGYLPDDELLRLVQESAVYVQASHHEGFGLAVAEAMLARCIPVVSAKGSLPEVVGDTGEYLDDLEPATIAATIDAALRSGPERGEQARRRILEEFPMTARAEGLERVVRSVSSGE